MSKGSTRRPTDEQKYQDNWERIWGCAGKDSDESPEGTDEDAGSNLRPKSTSTAE